MINKLTIRKVYITVYKTTVTTRGVNEPEHTGTAFRLEFVQPERRSCSSAICLDHWRQYASLPGRRSLHSTGINRLLVPPVKRSVVGSRAFPVAGPKACNALPEDVTSSQCEYTFCRQLKTWLFKKSFMDIVI